MTKKRHAKLLRAFITRVHEYGLKNGYPGGKAPNGMEMYKGVRMAMAGHIPEPYSRDEWWQKIGKTGLGIWGMGDIKEVNRKTK